MTYEVKWTGKFKKSFKLAKKRGLWLIQGHILICLICKGIPFENELNLGETKII